MPIYTKTGDDGTTSLFGGDRVAKDNVRIEVLGCIDELNSILGVVVSTIGLKSKVKLTSEINEVKDLLVREQKNMIRLGSDIATKFNTSPEVQSKVNRITSQDTEILEDEIDKFDLKLPKLSSFILPGGDPVAALAHHARSVCRRMERNIITLSKIEKLNPEIFLYTNRLSDWLFVIARRVNYSVGATETIYQQR